MTWYMITFKCPTSRHRLNYVFITFTSCKTILLLLNWKLANPQTSVLKCINNKPLGTMLIKGLPTWEHNLDQCELPRSRLSLHRAHRWVNFHLWCWLKCNACAARFYRVLIRNAMSELLSLAAMMWNLRSVHNFMQVNSDLDFGSPHWSAWIWIYLIFCREPHF